MTWWSDYTEDEIDEAIQNALNGGGGGTPAAPDTSIQFNNGGAFGGDGTITIEGTPKALVVANSGSAFGSLAEANNDQAFNYQDSGTGFAVLQATSDPTYDYNTILFDTIVDSDTGAQCLTVDLELQQDVTNSQVLLFVGGYAHGHNNTSSWQFVELNGTINGTASAIQGVRFDPTISGSISIYTAGYLFSPRLNGTHPITYGFYLAPGSSGGTLTNYFGLYSEDLGGLTIAQPYYVWFDSRGVFRIREDNTFDSVSQAIPALYNPQFPKYTAGAKAFERIIGSQWNGNVAEIGTERGPTQTLTSVTSVSTTATATLTNHGYRTGDAVTIVGANQAEYNGTYTVTRLTANTFSYTFAGSATSPATGTITAQSGTLRDLRLICDTLQFGTHTAIGLEVLSGYITVKDAGGTLRKLAVIS